MHRNFYYSATHGRAQAVTNEVAELEARLRKEHREEIQREETTHKRELARKHEQFQKMTEDFEVRLDIKGAELENVKHRVRQTLSTASDDRSTRSSSRRGSTVSDNASQTGMWASCETDNEEDNGRDEGGKSVADDTRRPPTSTPSASEPQGRQRRPEQSHYQQPGSSHYPRGNPSSRPYTYISPGSNGYPGGIYNIGGSGMICGNYMTNVGTRTTNYITTSNSGRGSGSQRQRDYNQARDN